MNSSRAKRPASGIRTVVTVGAQPKASVTIRGSVRAAKLPPAGTDITSLHLHNIKSDGVRAARELLRRVRPCLEELEIWYSSLNEKQWGLLFNALSGVRSRVRTSDSQAQARLLDCLKSEFVPPGAVVAETTASVGMLHTDDDESEVSDNELKRLQNERVLLRCVRLHGCRLGRGGCVHLMSVFKATAELQVLSMRQNGLDEIDAGILVRTLLSCWQLEELVMVDNGLGDAAAMILSQHLIRHADQITSEKTTQSSPTQQLLQLRSVDLSNNCIRPAGAIALGNMLGSPSRLHTLMLAGNCLTDTGAVAIATGMLSNGTITLLDLVDCAIQEQGICALLGAIQRNMILETMRLSRNTCESSIEEAVVELLCSNRNLKCLHLSEMGRGLASIQVLTESPVYCSCFEVSTDLDNRPW